MKKILHIACPNKLWVIAPLLAVLALAGCESGGKKAVLARKSIKGTGTSAEPDKVLYSRALDNIQHNRMEEGRLALQTLINTYPDSEYLAKAKLAVADSYYKQGGFTGMAQAIAEYQDFITFFPFLDEASYAQMQIGMAHYRNMEKPDRDRNEALEAEGALQTFLQKYPNSPLAAQGRQHLREVQEVLAEGDFRVARFYFLRRADRAAATRLAEVTARYPLYSQADRANWMLASLYERSEHNDFAGFFYARIVKDYPLSPLAGDSKAKLAKFGQPVPPADPTAMARMQAEQQIPRKRGGFLSLPSAMLKSTPNVAMAAHSGAPNMTPQNTERGETLTPGGNLSIGVASSAGGNRPPGPGATTGTGAIVETVTPGSSGLAASSATPAGSSATAAASSNSTSNPVSSSAAAGDPPADTASATAPAAQTTPANESSSKKKKGIKKLIPW